MKRTMRGFHLACIAAFLVLSAGVPAQGAAAGPHTAAAKTSIPYVPTRHDTVRDLLWLADVGANDVVYDLGSGDGRVVVAQDGALRGTIAFYPYAASPQFQLLDKTPPPQQGRRDWQPKRVGR
jgi:hypothetical protein